MDIKNGDNSTLVSFTQEGYDDKTTSTNASEVSVYDILQTIGYFFMGVALGCATICIFGCGYLCYKAAISDDDSSVAEAKFEDTMTAPELAPTILVQGQHNEPSE